MSNNDKRHQETRIINLNNFYILTQQSTHHLRQNTLIHLSSLRKFPARNKHPKRLLHRRARVWCLWCITGFQSFPFQQPAADGVPEGKDGVFGVTRWRAWMELLSEVGVFEEFFVQWLGNTLNKKEFRRAKQKRQSEQKCLMKPNN